MQPVSIYIVYVAKTWWANTNKNISVKIFFKNTLYFPCKLNIPTLDICEYIFSWDNSIFNPWNNNFEKPKPSSDRGYASNASAPRGSWTLKALETIR